MGSTALATTPDVSANLAIELEQVGTHDSGFARGFAVGYFVSKMEDRESFSRWVIEAQLPTLRALVGGQGQIVVVATKRNRWSVQFARVRVTFD